MNNSFHNHVLMVGFVVGEICDRELASGQIVTQWRFKIPRTLEKGSDSIPCSTSIAVVRKSLAKSSHEIQYQIEGQIRSRYWNVGGVMGSRVEVDVTKFRRFKATENL